MYVYQRFKQKLCIEMFHWGCGLFRVVSCFCSFCIFPALQYAIPKKGGCGWRYTSFFGKLPEISRYVTLPLAILDKARIHSWNGFFRKKSKQGGWGYGISRGKKEIACGISKG